MQVQDSMLFIDANKYLDLYRTFGGKQLLAPLGAQAKNIFVTQQVVNEVNRNKVDVAVKFLGGQFKALELQALGLPDHLFGTNPNQGKSIRSRIEAVRKEVKKINEEVENLALEILDRIQRSEDEVSLALTPIFADAFPHTAKEMKAAKERWEVGNPPGKGTQVIGDQLTWEQILTHFAGKKRLWIISRDGDYGSTFRGKGFLKSFLLKELSRVSKSPEVYLFEETVTGLQHFAKETGATVERFPSPEEIKEIRKEEEALANQTFKLNDDLNRLLELFFRDEPPRPWPSLPPVPPAGEPLPPVPPAGPPLPPVPLAGEPLPPVPPAGEPLPPVPLAGPPLSHVPEYRTFNPPPKSEEHE